MRSVFRTFLSEDGSLLLLQPLTHKGFPLCKLSKLNPEIKSSVLDIPRLEVYNESKFRETEGAAGAMKVSLVIPAYNESAIIADTLHAVSEKLSELTGDYEVLIVDDGSTDGTRSVVERYGDPRVRLEHYTPNRGKGRAVRTGMLAARGDIILCTDADLAYGTDVFSVILDRLAVGNADLVVGSRRISPDGYKNYPSLRLLASRCFGLLVRLISGLDYDTQCGIKGYRRQAARTIYANCTIDGFSFDFEVFMRADKLGLRVEQIPVSVVNFRESKVNIIQDSLRMFRDLFRIRRTIRKEDA